MLLYGKIRGFKRFGSALICLFALWVIFLYPNTSPAYAAQAESQLIDDTQSTASSDTFAFKQTIELDFDWEAATTTIEFDIDGSDGAMTFQWFWDTYTYTCSGAGYEFGNSERTKKTITTFPNCIQDMIDNGWNEASTRGWAIFYVNSNIRFWGSSNADSYINGVFYRNWGTDPDPNVKDAYFNISTPIVNSIEIIYPENSTTTPDFNAFTVSGYAIDEPFTVHLVWGTSSTTFSRHSLLSFDYSGDFQVGILKNSMLELDTTYYSLARLLECPPEYYAEGCLVYGPNDVGTFDILATSPLISFYIDAENPEPGGYLHIPTSTSTELVLTCDPNDNWFQQSICYGFQAMLKPKQEDWDRFENLGIAIQNKPPIGYFTMIKNSLTEIQTTSSLAFDLSVSTAALAPILTPFRTGLIFILWLAYAFWVFHRVRKLEL